MKNQRQKVLIVGSTGSIGTQTLDVIRENPDDFEIIGLAGYKNVELLNEQAEEFKPEYGVTTDVNKVNEILTEADIVVIACRGVKYLPTVMKAIKAGKKIAMANKRMIAEHGEEIMAEVKKSGCEFVPVDSEHSGVFQILQGRNKKDIEKVILTCSGGPFLNTPKEDFSKVTVGQALNHPKWKMGKRITLDSATLMNKAIEIIEAKYLFDLEPDQIEVLVHPQCIVHALVQFKDGSTIAHLGYPDMRLPISYALYYPNVPPNKLPRIDLTDTRLEFFKPDLNRFPSIGFAYDALERKGDFTKKLTSANDRAAEKFMAGEISFDKIFDLIKEETF